MQWEAKDSDPLMATFNDLLQSTKSDLISHIGIFGARHHDSTFPNPTLQLFWSDRKPTVQSVTASPEIDTT